MGKGKTYEARRTLQVRFKFYAETMKRCVQIIAVHNLYRRQHKLDEGEASNTHTQVNRTRQF